MGLPKRCHSCNRVKTLAWQAGPDGPQTLCDNCGFQYDRLSQAMRVRSADPTDRLITLGTGMTQVHGHRRDDVLLPMKSRSVGSYGRFLSTVIVSHEPFADYFEALKFRSVRDMDFKVGPRKAQGERLQYARSITDQRKQSVVPRPIHSAVRSSEQQPTGGSEPSKSISPKDAVLDYKESPEDRGVPLFHQRQSLRDDSFELWNQYTSQPDLAARGKDRFSPLPPYNLAKMKDDARKGRIAQPPTTDMRHEDVREQKARSHIPMERSLSNIDRLIKQSQDDVEMMELRHKTRRLRNSAAA